VLPHAKKPSRPRVRQIFRPAGRTVDDDGYKSYEPRKRFDGEPIVQEWTQLAPAVSFRHRTNRSKAVACGESATPPAGLESDATLSF
jgi:hypothetical protein